MNYKVVLIILILIIIPIKSYGKNVEIILKIDEEIITNIDINHEINYLKFLNPKLKDINEKNLYNIAKSSIIREIIKEKELNKILNIDADYNLKNSIEKRLINNLSLKNIEELKYKIFESNLKYKTVFRKLKIESLWNQYIFEKFNTKVNINENYLKAQVKKQKENIKPKHEYYLFEILFELSEKKNLNEKLNLIKESINNRGFKNTANIYSISDTSNFGGEIGWIKQTQVPENILNKIKDLEKNEISDYIETPNGYLLLKFTEKRRIAEKFNEQKNFNLLKQYETNRQLNQFSLIYYKRLKKNTIINEYK